jgi:hypothetical protein
LAKATEGRRAQEQSTVLIPRANDIAHTVSINGIFTSIQYNSEIDQDSAVLTYFSQLFKSSVLTTRILMQRISTLGQNYYNIKNKHQSIQAKPTQILYFQFFLALLIALHIDFPLLGIVSDLLHFYILVLLIAFSYAMHLRKY